MVGNLRYSRTGDNVVLRSALYDAWSQRCYWCSRPKDFVDIEIDHIVPRSVDSQKLATITTKLGLTSSFDVDALYNLAPICSHCNGPGVKGAANYIDRPLTQTQLDKATLLQIEVARRVEAFRRGHKVSKALVVVGEADSKNPKVRSALEMLGAAAFQKLVGFEFKTWSVISVDAGEYRDVATDVDIVLPPMGRRALVVLEEVFQADLAEILSEAMADLRRQIIRRCGDALEVQSDEGEPITVGDPEIFSFRLEINSLKFERVDDVLYFHFGGDFDVNLMASAVRSDSWGEGLDELQGESDMSGSFTFTLGDVIDRELVGPLDVEIEYGQENHWF